jgi:hypothetical protein
VRIVPFRGAYLRLARTDLVRGQVHPVPDAALPFPGGAPLAHDRRRGAGRPDHATASLAIADLVADQLDPPAR